MRSKQDKEMKVEMIWNILKDGTHVVDEETFKDNRAPNVYFESAIYEITNFRK
jgi:hypothetical protein